MLSFRLYLVFLGERRGVQRRRPRGGPADPPSGRNPCGGSPAPGRGPSNSRIVRPEGPRRHRISGGGGEEEQPGAETDGSDLPGSLTFAQPPP